MDTRAVNATPFALEALDQSTPVGARVRVDVTPFECDLDCTADPCRHQIARAGLASAGVDHVEFGLTDAHYGGDEFAVVLWARSGEADVLAIPVTRDDCLNLAFMFVEASARWKDHP